jgi:hypothetical protein
MTDHRKMTQAAMQRYVDDIKAQATSLLLTSGHHTTLLIANGPEPLVLGMQGVMGSDQEKDAAVTATKKLLREKAATGIIFITEAWLSDDAKVVSNPDGSVQFVRPALDPDRREALVIRWEFKTRDAGLVTGEWHQLFRHEGERIVLEETRDVPGEQSTGRMCDWLP